MCLPILKTNERSDTNSSRKRKKGENLLRRELKPGAIPRQWPSCPKLLSKTHPPMRGLYATSSPHLQTQIKLERIKAQKKRDEDTFGPLAELDQKLDINRLPSGVVISSSGDSKLFFSVSNEGKPAVNYCLKIRRGLDFEMWCTGKVVSINHISDPQIACLPSHYIVRRACQDLTFKSRI